MKKALSLISFLVLNLIMYSQSINWVKNMEGLRNCEGYSIALDASGNVYTTGYFDSIMDFDPGPGTYTLASQGRRDIFISKLNGSGNLVWAQSIGSSWGDEVGNTIKIDGSGNIFLTGSFFGSVDFDAGPGTQILTAGGADMFVLKLDAAGNYIWAKNMGGDPYSYIEGSSISIDPAGNIFITGNYTSVVDVDPGVSTYTLSSFNGYMGHPDCFIVKLDANGNFSWGKSFGINGWHEGNSIATDQSGNVYTTGNYIGAIDFDPGPGSYVLTSPSHNNAYVLKLNGAGNFMWAKQFGDTTVECYGNGIAVDYNNNVYTTGYFSGTKDFDPGSGTFPLTAPGIDLYISKLDSLGDFVWAKNTSSAYGLGQSISIDNTNNLYVIGKYVGSSDIDSGPNTYMFSNVQPASIPIPGVFFLKVGLSGLVKAAIVVGPGWGEQGMSAAVDPAGNVHATGYFQGSNGPVDFDMGPSTFMLNTTDRNNNFIIKLKAMGTTVGIDEFSTNGSHEFIISPNPNNGTFHIVSKEKMNLSLINNLGQIVQTIELNETNEYHQNIQINTSGIYYINGVTEQATVNQKIIVTQ